MRIIRRRVMIAMISSLVFFFVVASASASVRVVSYISLSSSFLLCPFHSWFTIPSPLVLLRLRLLACRDEGGCGGVSHGMYVFYVTLRSFSVVIIPTFPGPLERTGPRLNHTWIHSDTEISNVPVDPRDSLGRSFVGLALCFIRTNN